VQPSKAKVINPKAGADLGFMEGGLTQGTILLGDSQHAKQHAGTRGSAPQENF